MDFKNSEVNDAYLDLIGKPRQRDTFEQTLNALGVQIIGTGLGPVYRYEGICIASGIDEPTTIEKTWGINKRGRSYSRHYPFIDSYRKKYTRTVEMVNGKPVIKFVPNVYKTYDERNNPDEFIADIKIAVDALKKRLPVLRAKEQAYRNKWLSTLYDYELICMIPSNEWKCGYNGTLANGTKYSMYIINRNFAYVTTFHESGLLKEVYMINDGAHVLFKFADEMAVEFVNTLSTAVYECLFEQK